MSPASNIRFFSPLIFLVLTLLMTLPFLPAQAEMPRQLKVRVSFFAPYYFYDEDQKAWRGMSVDITRTVLEKAGFQTVFEVIPRGRAFELLKNGKLDLMLNLTRTREREALFDFIGPSSFEKMVMVTRQQDATIAVHNLDELIKLGKPIGFRPNYYYPGLSERAETDANLKKLLVPIDASYHGSIEKMLLRGYIFSFFEDEMVLRERIRSNPEFKSLVIHDFALSEPRPVHIAASRILPQTIRTKLHHTYRALWDQGIIPEILKQWGNMP